MARGRTTPSSVPRASQPIHMSTRGAIRDPNLAELAEAILKGLNRIADDYVAGLRAHPMTLPNVEQLTNEQLRDHLQTWLADVAQAMFMLHSTSADPSELMRDGTEIQRVIADRHGAQRHRLGWGPEALACEFGVLRGVLRDLVAEVLAARPAAELDSAQAVITGFVQHAEQISLRSLQHAKRTLPEAAQY